jgi:Outer membrane protein beta-barrel domain
MKISLKYVLLILLMVSFNDLHGQLRYGQVFGVNLSTMTYNAMGISYKPKISGGIHFGGFLELPIAENFVFQPELLFSAKGSVYKIDSVQYSISPIYAEIPLIFSYSVGFENFKFTLFAGPYFACGIGGNTLVTGGQYKNISFGSGENDDLERFDIGLNLGSGFTIKGFLICAQYGFSLINLAPSSKAETELKNTVIGISLISSMGEKR